LWPVVVVDVVRAWQGKAGRLRWQGTAVELAPVAVPHTAYAADGVEGTVFVARCQLLLLGPAHIPTEVTFLQGDGSVEALVSATL
jgi:hypothetical protein